MEFTPFNPTATLKRPKNFNSLSGQEFVTTTLKHSTQENRIAHAYLFAGPRGVGKTSAARILARTINCKQFPTAEPCGICTHCKEIQSGSSLDVIEIDGASNTSVNDIRQIKDEVLYAPHSCRYKVYIIDEVHMLSTSAFNALLKTIEEPPPYVVFIFATTEVHKVPATIRSRCQQYNFRLIPTDVIVSLLKDITKEFGKVAEDDALFWIAKEATGSLRDAYTLYDQVVAFCGTEITLEKIREKLGLVGLEQINTLATFFVKGNREDALLTLDQIITQGISAEQFITDLSEYFRSLLFIKSGITRESLLGYKKERFSSEVIDALNPTQIESALDYLLKLYRDIRFSLSQRFELELLISRLCSITKYFTNKELLGMIVNLKKDITKEFGTKKELSPPNLSTSQSNLPPSTQQPFTQNSPQENNKPIAGTFNTPQKYARYDIPDKEKIKLIIDALNRQNQYALSSSLSNIQKSEFDTNSATFYFDSNYDYELIAKDSKQLTDIAASIFGKPIAFHSQLIPKDEQLNSRDTVNPNVEMLKNLFKGEIVNQH